MINKLSLSLTPAEHLWMPYSIPKTQLAFLKPAGKFICQYGHIQIHLNCPKPFAKSLPVPSFKQRSMKLLIFLLNHSFQIFLPDFLLLNSFIPLTMSYPLETAFLCFFRSGSTFRTHVLLHVSEMNWKNWRDFH